jgi:hypothetical protein
MNWFEKLKEKFLEDCRYWYKLWSSWLAVLWGIIVTVFWNDPTLLGQLVNVLPEETRALLSPLVLGIVAALPIVVRLLKQQKLIDKLNGSNPKS